MTKSSKKHGTFSSLIPSYPTEKEVSDRLDELWDEIQRTPKWRGFRRVKLQEEFENLQHKEEIYKSIKLGMPPKKTTEASISPGELKAITGVQIPWTSVTLAPSQVASSFSHTFQGLTGATGPSVPHKQTTEELLAEIRDFLKKTQPPHRYGGTMSG